MGFADVVKTTVYLTDLADFAVMNEVYGRRFSGTFPARSTVQVAALPRGARIELEVLAVQAPRPRRGAPRPKRRAARPERGAARPERGALRRTRRR
jgi:hypothetical protein